LVGGSNLKKNANYHVQVNTIISQHKYMCACNCDFIGITYGI